MTIQINNVAFSPLNFTELLTEVLKSFEIESNKKATEFDGAIGGGLRAVIKSYESRVKQLTPAPAEPTPEPETEGK